MRKQHSFIYLAEFALIGGGFALLLVLPLPFYQQVALLGGILLSYIIIGVLHHKSHRDVTSKVMLEYILISALIFALFIFLNVSRI